MIRGVVTNHLEAWVDLAVVGDDLPTENFSAVIDTGFSDFLTLPIAVLEKFRAVPVTHVIVTLADGSEIISQLFELTVIWDGVPTTIDVHAAEVEPLVGMALLAGHDLHIRVVPDGEVTIAAIPNV
ncbi:MAG: clan AA aspartic protease [Planctomycetia bacterium]|nr:clan AA aspartic protease [Planctomycetia bacterium]